MSQSVELVVVVQGMRELLAAIAEEGFSHEEQKQFQAEDGRRHAVDLVVKDTQGTAVGVKLDARTHEARFVGHDSGDGRAAAMANRIAQRYAYSKTLADLKKKGYQITKEEKQKDGTIKLVAQRWR